MSSNAHSDDEHDESVVIVDQDEPIDDENEDQEEDDYEPLSEDDDVEVPMEVPMEEDDEEAVPDDHRLPLMFVGDQTVSEKAQNFSAVFASRYGDVHPMFYPGALSDAKLQSLSNPNFDERRALALYVHSDSSKHRDNFPKQVVCNPVITEYLSSNFITFGWDATQKEHKKTLYDALFEEGMDYVCNALQRYRGNHLPLVLLVTRTKRITFKLSGVIFGGDGVEIALEKLETATQEMRAYIQTEGAAQRERDARATLRQQQQAEYEASLKADRERELSAEREALAKEEAQAKHEAVEAAKEKRIADQTAALPSEPAATDADIIHVKFQFPGQPSAVRRFRVSDPLRLLTVFAESKGFLMEEYGIFSHNGCGKVNVNTHFDLNQSFAEVNWPAREALFVGLL